MLVRLGLTQLRTLLVNGEPIRAAELAGRLRERSIRQPELQLMEEVARGWLQARDQATRGEMAQSLETVDRIGRLLPGAQALTAFRAELEEKREMINALVRDLHEATEATRWRDVLELSEKILAAAPQHPEARKARGLAWKAVEPVTIAVRSEPVPTEKTNEAPSQRFLLWVDGVGGYLICLAPRVTVGQATPDGYVDIPLFADVSRLHAALTRESEGYLLEGMRPVQVNGQAVTQALLRPNDRITLGTSCQFQFRQPAPVSTSARLDLVSGHRLALAVDGVILMADTLLIGPGNQVHVSVPDLKQSLVLYRQKDGLGVRCPGAFTVDGQRVQDRAILRPNSTVSGEDFAFALEPLGMQLGRV